MVQDQLETEKQQGQAAMDKMMAPGLKCNLYLGAVCTPKLTLTLTSELQAASDPQSWVP